MKEIMRIPDLLVTLLHQASGDHSFGYCLTLVILQTYVCLLLAIKGSISCMYLAWRVSGGRDCTVNV